LKHPSNQQVQVSHEQMTWRSPLPPPQILQQYEAVIPGFSKKLQEEVYRESKHRRSNDRWLIRGGTVLAFFGHLCALTIVIFGLYVAWQLGMAGYTWTAIAIAGIDLLGISCAFLGRQIIASRNPEPAQAPPEPPQSPTLVVHDSETPDSEGGPGELGDGQ